MLDASRKKYETAVDLFSKGEKEAAALALAEIIEKEPGFTDAYETLGMVYYKMGLIDKAIEWTDKLVAISPSHAMAHTNLSVFYMKKGDKIKAEEEKAKATVLNFGKFKK